MLLIMCCQTQAPEPTPLCIPLRLLHQSPAIAPPPLSLGHNHGLHKQAAAVSHNLGEPGVAQQTLRPPVALQEDEADGELWTGLLQRVNPGRLTPPPLRVDQVSTWDQQVWTLVDGDEADMVWLRVRGQRLR